MTLDEQIAAMRAKVQEDMDLVKRLEDDIQIDVLNTPVSISAAIVKHNSALTESRYQLMADQNCLRVYEQARDTGRVDPVPFSVVTELNASLDEDRKEIIKARREWTC
jgi:hypothetical protein